MGIAADDFAVWDSGTVYRGFTGFHGAVVDPYRDKKKTFALLAHEVLDSLLLPVGIEINASLLANA